MRGIALPHLDERREAMLGQRGIGGFTLLKDRGFEHGHIAARNQPTDRKTLGRALVKQEDVYRVVTHRDDAELVHRLQGQHLTLPIRVRRYGLDGGDAFVCVFLTHLTLLLRRATGSVRLGPTLPARPVRLPC
jgi:hypothetical protein